MHERIHARRREVSLARQRRQRRVAGSVAIVVVLAILGVVAARSPLFAIERVLVRGAEGGRAEQVRAAAAILPGERLLTADLGRARDRVALLPWVRDVRMVRIPPVTVAVDVTPRVPVATVVVGDRSWLVDAGGVVISAGADADLVRIAAATAVVPPAGVVVADAGIAAALAVHDQLPDELRERVLAYDVEGPRALRAVVAWGERQATVRLGAAERVADKARVVLALLEQLEQTSDGPTAPPRDGLVLDVRAPDAPVVVPPALPVTPQGQDLGGPTSDEESPAEQAEAPDEAADA